MIPVVWLALLKKFGPWIAVVLLLFGIYAFGHSRGAAKWKGNHAVAVEERNAARETATHNAEEVVRLEAAIDAQNAAIMEMERVQSEQMAQVRTAHDNARRRQATSYQRAVEAARASVADLQRDLELMTVAETCHAAWVEVAQ